MHASPFCCMGLLSPLSLLGLGGDQAPPCLLPNTAPFLSCMMVVFLLRLVLCL